MSEGEGKIIDLSTRQSPNGASQPEAAPLSAGDPIEPKAIQINLKDVYDNLEATRAARDERQETWDQQRKDVQDYDQEIAELGEIGEENRAKFARLSRARAMVDEQSVVTRLEANAFNGQYSVWEFLLKNFGLPTDERPAYLKEDAQ